MPLPRIEAAVRAGVLGAGVLFYAVAVLEHPNPLAVAVGFAPIAWIALEALWRLGGGR